MSRAAFVYQPMEGEALRLAQRSAEAASKRGFEPLVVSSWDLDSQTPHGLRLAVTFGGDGTILRTARWLGGIGAAIVGVRLGRLGFLAELLPDEMPDGLEPYLSGDFWIDRRAMLQAQVSGVGGQGPGVGLRFLALNDVVVGRGASLRTVTVDITTDGPLLHRFRCDGLIAATATGSTAHSFAAGGPVLAPGSRDLVITPICPHISAVRALVVPGEQSLGLQLWSPQPGLLTVDGQVEEGLDDGATVEVRLSECETLFARRGTPGELYQRILAKLQ